MEDVRYARAVDGTHIAYQVLEAEPGASALDIVMVTGGLFSMTVFDGDSGLVRMLDGLRGVGRVVVFDRRGIGLSDPITDWQRSIIDQWADDLDAVVNAAGLSAPVIFAWDGFGVSTTYAARAPECVHMLVLIHPLGAPGEEALAWWRNRRAELLRNLEGEVVDFLTEIAPARATDDVFRDWYDRAGRVGASPATAQRIWEAVYTAIDDRPPLDQVHTPTLVLWRRDNRYTPLEFGHAIVTQLPRAELVELDGADHFPFTGDVDALVSEIAAFIVGERRVPAPQRLLAVVMFTDLVGSTERAVSLGDAGWKSLLDRHDAVVRTAVGRAGGTVVKHTGDGVLALLPSAGVAIRAATRVRDELAASGLAVYVGLHIGDIDRRGDDVSGLAVNIAARVMAAAGPGEIVVTASVRAAVAGQPVSFEPLGAHTLKGVPDEWELFRVG
jgi:class 3 adenylate cyclase/pimeloyl-ACP methyl ester carboxylesterase